MIIISCDASNGSSCFRPTPAALSEPWPLDQFGAQIRPCPRARPGGQPVGLKILKHKPDMMFFVILELKCPKKTLE